MTRYRYNQLWNSRNPQLTEQELDEGWHFCAEWYSLLIHESWPEFSLYDASASHCTCGCPRKGVNSNLGRLIP